RISSLPPCRAVCRLCRASSSSPMTRRPGPRCAARPCRKSRTSSRTPAEARGLRHVGTIAIEGVRRSFGSVVAVRDVTFRIGNGEFFSLLGPSGCGKTTLLRMIAGFAALDAGAIHIDGRRIDGLPPHRRNIGMVFQNYAIFPNLTVAGNIGYGLKARRVPLA